MFCGAFFLIHCLLSNTLFDLVYNKIKIEFDMHSCEKVIDAYVYH